MRTVRAMYGDAQHLGDADRKELIQHAVKSESDARLSAMLNLARHLTGIATDDADWDRNRWLFNTLTGTIEIDPESGSHQCREHRREDLITKLAPVKYDANAGCPRFNAFLAQIFRHDEEMLVFSQRALGACLISVPEEVLHVWYGTGANGKTTLMDVIRHVLGDYAVTMPQKFLSQREFDQIPHDLMDLRGARFAGSHEPDQRMVLDESKVKYLTGRDPIKARRLYRDLVEFLPTHKLVLVTNHKPTVRTQTKAIWRRIKLWPFEFTVTDEAKDTTIGEKLKAEAPGILNWLLKGCAEWVAGGRDCDPPDCVTTATVEYKREEDIIGDWLDKCSQAAPEQTAFKDIYASYDRWARSNGIEKPLSKKKVSRLLEEHGFRRRLSAGQVFFEGIRLLGGDDW